MSILIVGMSFCGVFNLEQLNYLMKIFIIRRNLHSSYHKIIKNKFDYLVIRYSLIQENNLGLFVETVIWKNVNEKSSACYIRIRFFELGRYSMSVVHGKWTVSHL